MRAGPVLWRARQYRWGHRPLPRETLNDRLDFLIGSPLHVLALLHTVLRHRRHHRARLAAGAVSRAVLGTTWVGDDPRVPALPAAEATDEEVTRQSWILGRHHHGAH